MTIASGDLNAVPGSPTVDRATDAGFVDAWLEAGNAECDPATHARMHRRRRASRSRSWAWTPSEGPGYDERIDYVMVRPGGRLRTDVEAEGFAVEPRGAPQRDVVAGGPRRRARRAPVSMTGLAGVSAH